MKGLSCLRTPSTSGSGLSDMYSTSLGGRGGEAREGEREEEREERRGGKGRRNE